MLGLGSLDDSEVCVCSGNLDHSRSAPRNPRCNGLVERTNRTLKTHVFKKMDAAGFDKKKHTTWKWEEMVQAQLSQENNAKISMYGSGVTPFLLYRGRAQNATDCMLSAGDLRELHAHCAEKMRLRGEKKKNEVEEENHHIPRGTIVRVQGTRADKRVHPKQLGPYSARGVVAEERAGNFYVLRYLTTGVNGEKRGEYSKRHLFYSVLKVDPNQKQGLEDLQRCVLNGAL